MIKKVIIKNYKQFENFSLELNSDINVIVGNNEAGKTTLFEAINLGLTQKLNGRMIAQELTPYLFNIKEKTLMIKGDNALEYLNDITDEEIMLIEHIIIDDGTGNKLFSF